LTAFVQPVETAARRGSWIFFLIAFTGVVATALLTVTYTRSIHDIATAADAISLGDLSRRLEPRGPDEIVRVATAFNSMTAGLSQTLEELSRRDALSAVGRFASELAHEVRNPLTSMRIDLQLLSERIEGEPGVRDIAIDLLRTVERLDRTVSGALEIARSGRFELTPVQLADPLRSAIREAMPRFAEKGAPLRFAGVVDVTVLGDADSLHRLFLNILTNAAEALSGDGDSALVTMAVVGAEVRVSIVDTGPGLPPQVVSRAFDPFFTTKPQGTGLGLAIARRIADAHRGVLEMASPPGGGTEIVLTLPRLEVLSHT
jgi:two-component system sensor histidine kinase AtoS